MFKARNKKFSLLMALIFAFTVIFPVGAAFADTDYVKFSKAYKYVSADDGVDVGSVTVTWKAAPSTAQAVYFKATLPDGVEFSTEPTDTSLVTATDSANGNVMFDSADDNYIKVYVNVANWNDANDSVTFNFNGAGKLDISDDFSGNLDVNVEAIGVDSNGNIVWSEEDDLTVAKVASGKVTVDVGTLKKVSVGGGKKVATITLKESQAGDINQDWIILDSETSGVTFSTKTGVKANYIGISATDRHSSHSGSACSASSPTDAGYSAVMISADGEQAYIKATTPSATFPGEIEFKLYLDIDPDVSGDIEISVWSTDAATNGNNADVDEIVTVATVGDVTAKVDKVEDNDNTVYCGQTKKLDTEITLKTTDGSDFESGDIITFKLNKGEFVNVQVEDNDKSHSSVKLYSDDEAFYYTVPITSPGDEIKIDDIEITLDNDVEPGDITLTISGDYGDVGEVVIATAAKPYTVTAEKPSILAEALGQEAGDLIITEADGGAIDKDEEIYVELPSGVELTAKPKIEVTEGSADAKIDEYGDEYFVIKVTKESGSKPSVFRVYNIKYDTGKLALAGDVELKFYGDKDPNNDNDYDDDSVMTTVVNAVVVDEKVVTASFSLGDEGVAIQNGRMLVQVNTLCDVLGLQKSWDAANKVAYFVKNGTVVAFPIDQNKIIINGNTIPVDQGGTIINGYTYATLRGLEMAFGGKLSWDNVTKTATFKF